MSPSDEMRDALRDAGLLDRFERGLDSPRREGERRMDELTVTGAGALVRTRWVNLPITGTVFVLAERPIHGDTGTTSVRVLVAMMRVDEVIAPMVQVRIGTPQEYDVAYERLDDVMRSSLLDERVLDEQPIAVLAPANEIVPTRWLLVGRDCWWTQAEAEGALRLKKELADAVSDG